MEFLKKFFNNFVELTRCYALGVTLVSCFLVFSYAHYYMNFTFLNFTLLLIAMISIHLGANLFDDYIDIKLKLKEVSSLEEVKFNSFDDKARLILNRTFSLKEVEIIITFFFTITSLIGIYFIFNSGIQIIFFALIGGLLSLFYPISAKYYLQEIILGLIYGPLMVMGGFFALVGFFDINLFLASIPVGIAIALLGHVHNILDWEFDIENNKKTIAILLKSKEKAIDFLKYAMIFNYTYVFIGVILGFFNPKTLYVFLTLPVMTEIISSIKDYIYINDVKFIPKWYFGPFEMWDKIVKKRTDFYMFRIYLARNYALFFTIFFAIGSMI